MRCRRDVAAAAAWEGGRATSAQCVRGRHKSGRAGNWQLVCVRPNHETRCNEQFAKLERGACERRECIVLNLALSQSIER